MEPSDQSGSTEPPDAPEGIKALRWLHHHALINWRLLVKLPVLCAVCMAFYIGYYLGSEHSKGELAELKQHISYLQDKIDHDKDKYKDNTYLKDPISPKPIYPKPDGYITGTFLDREQSPKLLPTTTLQDSSPRQETMPVPDAPLVSVPLSAPSSKALHEMTNEELRKEAYGMSEKIYGLWNSYNNRRRAIDSQSDKEKIDKSPFILREDIELNREFRELFRDNALNVLIEIDKRIPKNSDYRFIDLNTQVHRQGLIDISTMISLAGNITEMAKNLP